MFGLFGVCMSCMEIFRNGGENLDLWGTPLYRWWNFDLVLLWVTLACLPLRMLTSHFLSLVGRCVSRIFADSSCRGNVSKALLMSRTRRRVHLVDNLG